MKVSIFSAQSVGGTFLDWSIHFLSGQTEYFHSKTNQFIPLVKNPINQSDLCNAHEHRKNHPGGAKKTKLYLNTCNHKELYSLYATIIPYYDLIEEFKINPTKENFNLLKHHQRVDTENLFLVFKEHSDATIHLAGESYIPLYFTKHRSLESYMLQATAPESVSQLEEEHNSFFFSDSTDCWNNLGLNEIWDIRERNALNIRPLDNEPEFYLTIPHLRIDCREFWYHGEVVIKRVMDYLSLKINNDNLSTWKSIYYNWCLRHIKSMEFSYNCDHIVSAIINNWNYKIDLTFNQEVIVQHFLIYRHGLNLKTWQLEKFPDNTQKLHQLLETNIHPIAQIY